MLQIPTFPNELVLPINHEWDGPLVSDPRLVGEFRLSKREDGIQLIASGVYRLDALVPKNVGMNTRYEGLWEYDVLEVFLVGENGHYVEVELNQEGQFLVLGFDGVRHRSHEYLDFNPHLDLHATMGKGDRRDVVERWSSSFVLPWAMTPSPVVAVNAFGIMGGHFMAYFPLPGEKPDFHQPARFPRVSIV